MSSSSTCNSVVVLLSLNVIPQKVSLGMRSSTATSLSLEPAVRDDARLRCFAGAAIRQVKNCADGRESLHPARQRRTN